MSREDSCETGNDFIDEYMGVRVSSVFVVLVASLLGVFLPILSSQYSFMKLPPWLFFVAKYFGTGVIVTTGFVHLLLPASENLSNECLGGTFVEYPWAYGISLMSLFAIFFVELLAHNIMARRIKSQADGHVPHHVGPNGSSVNENYMDAEELYLLNDLCEYVSPRDSGPGSLEIIGVDSRKPSHMDLEASDKETYYAQLVSTFVLEFGIIFHSVFVGLTLAVSGQEFKTLYIVVVFHQMFEGLGLGTRVASTTWPPHKKWLPYLFGFGFGLTTPLAIAMGLVVRTTYSPGSRQALITRGVCDAISSGILIYSGVVELMAHEFLYSNQFKGKPMRQVVLAYLTVCAGAGIMALLGKWV